jgi:putative tricarboxylic transport membrane protein
LDRIGAVMLMVFGAFWVWHASRLTARSADAGPGPSVLPTALGVLMVVLAAISFVRPEIERIELPNLGRIALIFGSIVGYALLLEPLGYVVATAVLLAFLLVAFAERRAWWQPAAAVAISLGTYYVFRILLSVPLPPDPLDLLR